MMNQIKQMFARYKEIILYGFFGLGATFINIFSFFLLRQTVGAGLMVSNVLAWILAFIFAFITNKLWVFESKDWHGRTAAKEMTDFLAVRLATLALDIFCMWLAVHALHINEVISKIVVNMIVIVLNYAASRLWVFKNKGEQ